MKEKTENLIEIMEKHTHYFQNDKQEIFQLEPKWIRTDICISISMSPICAL